MTQAAHKPTPAARTAAHSDKAAGHGRRTQVRDSGIHGKHEGNSAKWINHSCEPNLEAEQVGNRVFLDALRDIAPGEELFFDYGLVIDARMTPKLKKEYACWCGAPTCRGTML